MADNSAYHVLRRKVSTSASARSKLGSGTSPYAQLIGMDTSMPSTTLLKKAELLSDAQTVALAGCGKSGQSFNGRGKRRCPDARFICDACNQLMIRLLVLAAK